MTVSDAASAPPGTDGGTSCGSCSKGRDEVHAMFAAQSAFICNECVMLFTEEVAEHREDGWHPGKALAPAAEEKSERR